MEYSLLSAMDCHQLLGKTTTKNGRRLPPTVSNATHQGSWVSRATCKWGRMAVPFLQVALGERESSQVMAALHGGVRGNQAEGSMGAKRCLGCGRATNNRFCPADAAEEPRCIFCLAAAVLFALGPRRVECILRELKIFAGLPSHERIKQLSLLVRSVCNSPTCPGGKRHSSPA